MAEETAEGLLLVFHDRALGRKVKLAVELLVQAAALVPPRDNPLAQLYKVPLNQDGFFQEAHAKLKPVEFATDGVFLCGLAHSPMPVEEAIATAQAAAAKAAAVLARKSLKAGGPVAVIDARRCVGCGVCLAVCPYQAIAWDDKGKAAANPALCKACGLCVASCRSHAPDLLGFTDGEILAQLTEL